MTLQDRIDDDIRWSERMAKADKYDELEADLAKAVSLLDDVQHGNKWWSAIAAFVQKHKKETK